MKIRGKFVFDDLNKQLYLEHLEHYGLPHRAARHIGTIHKIVKREQERDEEFDAACEEAMDIFRESVEEEVRRRAVDGVLEPVFYKGEECGSVRKYSDNLLTLLVKTKNPAYGDKLKVDTTVHGGVLLTAAPASTPEQWLEAQRLAALPPADLSGDADTEEDQIIDVPPENEPVPA